MGRGGVSLPGPVNSPCGPGTGSPASIPRHSHRPRRNSLCQLTRTRECPLRPYRADTRRIPARPGRPRALSLSGHPPRKNAPGSRLRRSPCAAPFLGTPRPTDGRPTDVDLAPFSQPPPPLPSPATRLTAERALSRTPITTCEARKRTEGGGERRGKCERKGGG